MSRKFSAMVSGLLMLAGAAAHAQEQGTAPAAAPEPAAATAAITVATREIPPFVIREGDGYSGFSVDLWRELASRTGTQFEWLEKRNVAEILSSVDAGEADVAIAAISITSEREQRFDFSQPMFESGLQIMVPQEQDSGFSLSNVGRYFTQGAMPYLLGILALLILVPGHLVWWAERKHDDSPFSRHYFPGIFHAMGWALSAAAGQQNDNPRSRLGRVTSIAAIFVSLLFLTYWQAELTSSFTVQQLQGGIQGPDDLPGKRVGTLTGSTSAQWAATHQVKTTEFEKIAQAFEALEKGRVEAVVYDSPVLLFHAASSGRGKVRVVGPVFKKENYGIVFPPRSGGPRKTDLRKKVNEALLRMREDGTYDRIYRRWFTTEE
ncbi:MAG: transporter substrate-binding domain-containing protein [Rhizobiales bacterium]|nr:transporter substrate-binding domain-containing protein [Hyphomicrobiales bacterium]